MSDLNLNNFTAMLTELAAAITAREEREHAKDVAYAERLAKLEDANSATLSLQLALDDATAQIKTLVEQVNAATPAPVA